MKHRGRQRRVGTDLKHFGKMLGTSRAAGSDDGNGETLGKGAVEIEIKAVLHAVGINGIDADFPGAQSLAALCPFDGVDAGVFPAAFDIDVPAVFVVSLGVDGEHHALLAETQGSFANELGTPDRGGVDRDFIGTGQKGPPEILGGGNAAADGKGNAHGFGNPLHNIQKNIPLLIACRDVIKHQLIGAFIGIASAQSDGVVHILNIHKAFAFDHPAVIHIQTGNDAFGQHIRFPL